MVTEIKPPEMYRLYNDLSWTWPIISSHESYIEEGNTFISMIKKYAKIETRTLLDLGCGGGHMDWVLKKAFEIMSIDKSRNMLELARKLNPEIIYTEGDMRKFRTDRKFDAVVIHDSINYMLTPVELRAAFLTAYVHLKSCGLMIAYAEQWPENFMQNRVKYQTGKKGDTEITFIENYYDPDSSDTTYESTFIYLIRRRGHFDIQTDRHICGIMPLSEWRLALQEIGFFVYEDRFVHSEFALGEYYPFFIAIKQT
jgi:SAM-dependent methyltransferase